MILMCGGWWMVPVGEFSALQVICVSGWMCVCGGGFGSRVKLRPLTSF